MKIAGVKINKTAIGKIKSVEIDYKKFTEYIDDFLDVMSAKAILKHDKIRTPLKDIIEKENKRKGLK